MRWFRTAAVVLLVLTQLLAIAMTASIIAMCTNVSHSHSMDGDPAYNGFLFFYILILVFQFLIITIAFLGYWVAFKNWKNNYQMDHSQRTKFVTFLALWIVSLLANCGVAIFSVVRGKEHQEEMAYLYEKFAKYNQDTKFVAHLERYQREKGCCGVYGPDDWLMVQLRSNSGGGGGGGGGYQSLDYGFMQNPSTGKCHLLPPTVPMGCGRIILEELHIQLNTYAGFMILESLIGMIAAAFMAYCFFYWLEKEVIVIPENEVSNLIVLEPESSTDMAVDDSGYFGSGVGSGDPYLGPPVDFPSGGYGSTGGSTPSRRATGYYSGQSYYSGPTRPGSNFPSAGGSPPSGISPYSGQPGTEQPPGGVPNIVINGPSSEPAGQSPPPAAGSSGGVQEKASPLVSHFDHKQSGSHASRKRPTVIRVPAGLGTSKKQAIALAASRKSTTGKPHSKNHMLHSQEKALARKLIGQLHVDHVAIARTSKEELEDQLTVNPHVAEGSDHQHQPAYHTGSVSQTPHPHSAHHGGYLPPGQHQHDHYLNAGSYAHAKSHESNRYLDPRGYIHHDHHHHGSRSRRGSHHSHHSDRHDHHDHDHHDHHDHEYGHYLPDGAGASHQGHHRHWSDRLGGSSGGGRQSSRHQSRSRPPDSSSNDRSSPGNSRNNNPREESKKSFRTQTLYAAASRSPSRFVTRDVPVHHHVIHKHVYEPQYSRSRDYRKHSVRTVTLYRNSKPLIDD